MKTKNIAVLAIFTTLLWTNVESKKEKGQKKTAKEERRPTNPISQGNGKRPYYYYNNAQPYYPAVSPNRPGGGGRGPNMQKRPVVNKNPRPQKETRPRPQQKQTRPYYSNNNARPYYPVASPNRPGGGGRGPNMQKRPVANKNPGPKQKETRPYYFNNVQPYYTVASPNGPKEPKSPPKKRPVKQGPPKKNPPPPKVTTKNPPTTTSPNVQPAPSPQFPTGNGNNFGSCRICSTSWRVPDPRLTILDETCSYWNMKEKGDVYCPDIQATYGSACGCPDAPVPTCNVCPQGDYVWKQVPRYNTFTDDFCVRMIYKMSKNTQYCMGNKNSVAKMCCSNTRTCDGSEAKSPALEGTGKIDKKTKSPKDDGRSSDRKKEAKTTSASDGRSKEPKTTSASDGRSKESKNRDRSSSVNKSSKRNASRDFRSPSAPIPPSRTTASDDNTVGNGGGRVEYYYYYGVDDDYYRQ